MLGSRTPTQAREWATHKQSPILITAWDIQHLLNPFSEPTIWVHADVSVIPKLYTEQSTQPKSFPLLFSHAKNNFTPLKLQVKMFPCELHKSFIKICLSIKTLHRF